MKSFRTQKFTVLRFWLLFTNLMKTAKIPILHHTVMEDILINTPKVRQSNKTQKKQTKQQQSN